MHSKVHSFFAVAVLAASAAALPPPARASSVIATINGYYDVDNYDTPSLHFDNSSAYNFTDVTLKLTGYQGLNKGLSQTISLPDITAGTTSIYTWSGPTSAKNLLAYDYDDEYNGTFTPATGYGLSGSGSLVAAPQCSPEASIYGWGLCAQVGNFYVTFTAKWNGKSVYSQFSPDPNLPLAGNAAGTFVGWEGLDPNGWSETTFDSHSSGGPNGVLANIYVGTPPTAAPEPASFAMLGAGLLALAAIALRRSRHSL